MEDDPTHSLYEYLQNWLRHKNDMVVYEAARAICNLKDVTDKELFPAISGIMNLISFTTAIGQPQSVFEVCCH